MSPTKWILDPHHSEITFKIRHLMISNVTGRLQKFDVTVEGKEDNFDTVSKVTFTADVDSVTTANESRDTHLKSPDFFDAATYPQITFIANHFHGTGEERKLHGDLTIRDVTLPVIVDVEYGGIVKDGYGQTKAGFTISAKINRKDFGLVWNATTETGGVVAGDEIKIKGEIQLIKST
ncbi:MAG TPA: YceI family protein [Flavisolibacter sp.]|jgi:polyisoprenoid-binding protein YceI|nr:YceI family protein [Flavisolibacter sp.]